ncbi:exocyst complex component SEC8 [Amborella trichopoda]|uniref:exocyst complex component SEC8 n=1 Tax=Amborella trichopoda TaxID=13333 RepID=UPI0005D3A829|nr:exocyst complex component SEC8 [Amborella trichopoda]XP_020523181.1 exocyst complex component SEC8 [Amborella trichopoda]XP_020523182.1 exocyst complex component SEC8 [Amborella trichopoda]|eukprot:XP_011623573.1 exocyst complex component SEC8 [Amborella trichopoda]
MGYPGQGLFDKLPVSRDKSYLRDELSKIDEGWTATRFDSLPHVVHILTSKDREGEVQFLKEQSEVIEEVVDEVVHEYHSGFNKAIQNYSQILRLFSESAESLAVLKVDLAESKKLIGSRNKQLHQLWYRSVTLRHIISLLDQIENVSKVPARIEKLIAEKQYYAAVQLHVQSTSMLEREGLQGVGALQDVRSELTKLRGVLFFKVLEDLHGHLYNQGEYSSTATDVRENDDDVPISASILISSSGSHPVSRRTRGSRVDGQVDSPSFGDGFRRPGSIDGSSSFDGLDDESVHPVDTLDGAASEGAVSWSRVNGFDGHTKETRTLPHQLPSWLSNSTPNEFIESMKKSDAPLHVKYLHTSVECLCMLGKVAAAGVIICQRLRPTVQEIITSKIKAQASVFKSSRLCKDRESQAATPVVKYSKGTIVENYIALKQKNSSKMSPMGALWAVSPVSQAMAPTGAAQAASRELLDGVLDTIIRILENHVLVGELLESRLAQKNENPETINGDINWSPDSEASQVTGGYSVGFALVVLQSECQQLICEILRATPEAASADAAVQTARLASKVPSKDTKDGSEEGLSFAFRFTDAAASVSIQGVDGIRQGWGRRNPTTLQEGYGTTAVLNEQGIYLVASLYRPVLQFTDKVASMLPPKYSQLGNDGLQAFVENFLKDHFLPAMFVDYRKCVQQAISSPAAFRPRARAASTYSPLIEKGRPVLQGLLAIDFLAKEVLGWAQAMPKYANELVEYVHTFLERAHERCRTSFMEAVLEKQSYMLIGRQDVESLMKLESASSCLPNSFIQASLDHGSPVPETSEIEMEMSDLLLSLRPIKQENLIRDDQKLILLAALSDSLEYVADSIERLGQASPKSPSQDDENVGHQVRHHTRTSSALTRNLASLADEYRSLAVECLKVLRIEMQLETIFHFQEMTSREYLDDQDAEEPDDFIISLTTQITRRDEEVAPFIVDIKRNYIFGGICSVAANASIKALAEMKSINLFGVQQICRNSIALEQALAAIPSIDSEAVQQRLDRIRTYYELLNLPFEALLAFIAEHEYLFTASEYSSLLKVEVPGREIPDDAMERINEILVH